MLRPCSSPPTLGGVIVCFVCFNSNYSYFLCLSDNSCTFFGRLYLSRIHPVLIIPVCYLSSRTSHFIDQRKIIENCIDGIFMFAII